MATKEQYLKVPICDSFLTLSCNQLRALIEKIYTDRAAMARKNNGEFLRKYCGFPEPAIQGALQESTEEIAADAASLADALLNHPDLIGAAFLDAFLLFAGAFYESSLAEKYNLKPLTLPIATRKSVRTGLTRIEESLKALLSIRGRPPVLDSTSISEYERALAEWKRIKSHLRTLIKSGVHDIAGEIEREFNGHVGTIINAVTNGAYFELGRSRGKEQQLNRSVLKWMPWEAAALEFGLRYGIIDNLEPYNIYTFINRVKRSIGRARKRFHK